MSDPANNQALADAVLNQMRKDWIAARPFLQATQGWPDTDCDDVSAAIAAAIAEGDRDELLSWSVWLASKAADARASGFHRDLAEKAHRAAVLAEALTTQAEWKSIQRGLIEKHGGEDKSRMTMKARP